MFPRTALIALLGICGATTLGLAEQSVDKSVKSKHEGMGSRSTVEEVTTATVAPSAEQRGNANELVSEARLALESGDAERACELAREATELEPTNKSLAWNTFGRALLELDEHAEAILAFIEATREDPENAFAWNNLGYAHLLCDQPSEALEPLEKAVALDSEIAYMHNNLGVALERTGELVDAHAAYERATELDPDYARAADNTKRLAAILARRGAVSSNEPASRVQSEPGAVVD